MPSDEVTLAGLDGSNPLAFLASLGILRVLDHRARQTSRDRPRLSWIDLGCWRPVLHGVSSLAALVAELVADRASWADDPAILLAYDPSGETLVDPRKESRKATRDLKARPLAMRVFLEGLASRAAVSEAPLLDRSLLRRALDTAAAYGSELVQDNNGNTKPTAFHFTAGQQQFLKAISELQAGVAESDFREALAGPWRRESTLPNMSWDATNARLYALRANNPSGDKKTTIAGADWLAFVGLGLLPSFPVETRLATTGVTGGWKDGRFTWPMWSSPTSLRVVGSILRIPDLTALSSQARAARQIASVFRANITRSDQGGYGGFSPAEVM